MPALEAVLGFGGLLAGAGTGALNTLARTGTVALLVAITSRLVQICARPFRCSELSLSFAVSRSL